jgi:hypothetical protein
MGSIQSSRGQKAKTSQVLVAERLEDGTFGQSEFVGNLLAVLLL